MIFLARAAQCTLFFFFFSLDIIFFIFPLSSSMTRVLCVPSWMILLISFFVLIFFSLHSRASSRFSISKFSCLDSYRL